MPGRQKGFCGSVESAEAFSNNFAAVGDHHKCAGHIQMNVISQHDCLAALHDGKDDGLFRVGVSSFCPENSGAAVQIFSDEIADGHRIIADDGEIFAQVDVFDDAVNDQGFCHQAGKGKQTGLGVKEETGSDSDQKIYDK